MKSIYNYYSDEYLDEKFADLIMDEVVARARAKIAEAAESDKLKDISDAIAALEQPKALAHLFNTILSKIIPGTRIVFFPDMTMAPYESLRDCVSISTEFRKRYVDKFDEDEKLAIMLLKAMTDRIKDRKK